MNAPLRQTTLRAPVLVCLLMAACGDDAGSGGSGAADAGGAGGADAANAVDAASVDAAVGHDGGERDAGTHDAGQRDGGAGAGGGGGCRALAPATTFGNACHGTPPPSIKPTLITATGTRPVFITHAPGDRSRLFVVGAHGPISIIKDGVLLPEPFLDLGTLVTYAEAEQGLLGMAFDPSYATTGRFYVNYVRAVPPTLGGETVIAEYRVSTDDPDRADPNSARTLIVMTQPEANHNGGMLAFGPDGCMYVGFGDGGGRGDAHGVIGNGQDTSNPLGDLLRLDIDRFPEPAPGNLQGDGVYPHIWDSGLRNPWRFSFDRVTGDLYIGDVGQSRWEEVDVEPPGAGPRNYGWKITEGKHCRGEVGDGGDCDRTGLTPPVHEYRNPTEGAAVIGGYVYRGSRIPGLVGRYIYADYGANRVRLFTWTGSGICDEAEVTDQLVVSGSITSFGEDADGELYFVTIGTGGNVYRIDPAD